MTANEAGCCGNCAAFMRDPFNSTCGACAVIDDYNVETGTYPWTTEDGDCDGWKPSRKYERKSKSRASEQALYERRMRGDWS